MISSIRIITIIIGVIVLSLLVWLGVSGKWQYVVQGELPRSTAESKFPGYECSRKIEGKWTGNYFQPSNQEDVKKYCRQTYVIEEYRAVLDILRKDDVNQAIEKYNTAEAWVKALSHEYIHDKDYLRRILPAYSDVKIDCIIVVHTPESTRFFIENGDTHDSHDDHRYLEVAATEFLSSLNRASDADITNFWLGLH